MFGIWKKKKKTPATGEVSENDALVEAPSELTPSIDSSSAQTLTQENPAQQTVLTSSSDVLNKSILEEATPEASPEMLPIKEMTPSPAKISLFKRFSLGLKRTSVQFSEGIGNIFLGKKTIDANLLDEIETHLLMADVGTEATRRIIDEITARVKRRELMDSTALFAALKQALCEILVPCNIPLEIPKDVQPYVILMVGVNGAGKTTTIGKLAKRFQQQGKSVMLAAGDTFRAAAIEQLQAWGKRNQVDVIAQKSGSDSASVIYDALNAAKARHIDVLIADTAGRLHTQSHLMEELKKIKKVLGKIDEQAPHETLLVLDAGIGQNTLRQAEQFNEALKLNGIILTKLDGTAKGGVIFSLAQTLGLPIRFVGVGEGIDDLQPFNAETFVEALFGSNSRT